MTKKIILNFLRENRILLREQLDVQKIGLLGSYACDEATISSDIAVEIESKNSFRSFFFYFLRR